MIKGLKLEHILRPVVAVDGRICLIDEERLRVAIKDKRDALDGAFVMRFRAAARFCRSACSAASRSVVSWVIKRARAVSAGSLL